MPLTQKQLNEIKYVSMKDFSDRIDQIADINDKLKFASHYLLMHGTVENPDVPIQDAINIARMKILHESSTLYDKMIEDDLDPEDYYEDAVNPYAEDYEDDAELELFIGKPAEYLKGLALKKYNELDNIDILIPEERKLKEYYDKQAKMYSNNSKLGNDGLNKNKFLRIYRETDSVDDMTRYYGSKEALDKAFAKTKQGFFSRMFSKPSNAYTNLEKSYEAYSNPNSVYYRNSELLEQAAGQYIKHKFPNWEPGDPFPSETDINKLNDTSKERMLFSISVFKATEESHEKEEHAMITVSTHQRTETTFDRVDGIREAHQQQFRNELNNSVDESRDDESEMDYSKDEIIIVNNNEMEV